MDDLIIEIHRIVADMEGRNEASIKLNDIIEEMTEAAYLDDIKNDKNQLNTILTDAVSIGQGDGFVTGFKWGIRLLMGCLHEK